MTTCGYRQTLLPLRPWLLWVLFAGALRVPAVPSAWRPVEFPAARVEADWEHTDQVRYEAARLVTSGETGGITPEQDAVGGCDGVINGMWGFHTENEATPWWQVDLGEALPVDRVVVYNRCDTCSERTARMQVLLSADGQSFRQVYEHDGTLFLGHADQKPLRIEARGESARYVRLQLPGTSYFHLDEVEVYVQQHEGNVALGRPATQSSVSQWSALHGEAAQPQPAIFAAAAVDRGLRLIRALQRQGCDLGDAAARLEQYGRELEDGPDTDRPERSRELYLSARRLVRTAALSNPLLDFDSILFVKSVPPRFPHMSDQFYGWWSRPGGGIFVLRGLTTGRLELRCLTEAWPEGSFVRPELSYDGSKVLFAYCRYYPHVADVGDKVSKENIPEDAFYAIHEMDLQSGVSRSLTSGRYDDFDARYLPNDDIVFLSTRKGVDLQVGRRPRSLLAEGPQPDSYVRCGGDNYRPVPVFALHRMAADGSDVRPISAFENFEWTPSIAADGRILYTRWDYIDRFNGHFFSLWSTNPDGTRPQLVYGNYTVRPQVVLEAVSVPGSQTLVFTAAAHHSITGGALALLDRNRGTEGDAPITRLTPEVPFPETEAWAGIYYANPFPLSEEVFLVAFSDQRLPPHSRVDDSERNPPNSAGIYLYDACGNLELLYRDPAISSWCPIPVRPRTRPPVYADVAAAGTARTGRFFVQDVYQGLDSVPRGSVTALRVIGVPPKVQPLMNTPNLGVSSEDPGKFLIGTVPVAADGSAFFEAPSGVSVFFQALDDEGMALQTMRTLTYVWPGETSSCIGCHEGRETAPASQAPPQALLASAARLRPGPEGSWPLSYDHLVQPVLDRHCVSCHRPDSAMAKAQRLDLTPGASYQSLLAVGDDDLRKLAFEKDRSMAGDCPARKSRILAALKTGEQHRDLALDAEAMERLIVWMDLYAQRQGHFSAEQELQLSQLRAELTADPTP